MSGIPIYTLSAINQFTATPSELRITKVQTTSTLADDSRSKPAAISPTSLILPSQKQPLQPKRNPLQTIPPPLDHPPGYQQNIYAAEPNHEVRRAMEVAASMEQHEIDDGSKVSVVWNTTKNWAASTGEKIVETEKIVWRRMSKTQS